MPRLQKYPIVFMPKARLVMNDNGPKATFVVANMAILKISKKALIISMKTFRTYLPNYLQSGLRVQFEG